MLRKYDRLAPQSRFAGSTAEAFAVWRKETRTLLQKLLGLDKMELCPPQPVNMDGTVLTGGIRREHWRIQVEPEVFMTLFLLAPPGAGSTTPVFPCSYVPPGHRFLCWEC